MVLWYMESFTFYYSLLVPYDKSLFCLKPTYNAHVLDYYNETFNMKVSKVTSL